MYDSLSEVIQLTKDLLADAKQQHTSAAPPAAPAAPSAPVAAAVASSAAAAAGPSAQGGAALGGSQIVTPAALNAPSMLPEAVADQIRKAQQRSALLGQAQAGWAVGAECLAYYAADGQWYPGVVEGVTEDGKFVVLYEGYGNKEELVAGSVRPRAEEVREEVYKGVAAPKRKRVEDEPEVTEIPKTTPRPPYATP
ncbi:survival of motorneuron-related-splicing factor 30 [Monoraphidium neglectum]|uniref:Survival of motorneuron-related-splicing factor 30 n=1 Tax=Monoraphidium neglectum TaxID=145388 RepID=A0A0D2KIN6_9CHLO|nr:survival of motorneuron-related-splicing factor 30 [Monoraphidium neglectum]KIY95633.1 survival of motorneuron-related-splicing factor 30 [Monoraphidium neglectum]|eukprot:XP_013894653.1 survival of motorneuron-related-splicing factor 30 [Monoraphidium neglectum]